MNNNIIVDNLIETFHHPSRRLISNSLHFSSSQCCILIIKTMDIIVTTLLLHDQFYYSTLDIDRYLWEQRERRVRCSHVRIRNSIIHRDVTKRACGSNLLQPRIIFYDSIRSKYTYIYKANGHVISVGRNWHNNSMRKSFSWKVERGTSKRKWTKY